MAPFSTLLGWVQSTPVCNLILQNLEGWEVGGDLPYLPGSDGPECDVKTNEARGRHFTRHFSPQIREQMSGPDLHVFTLKSLALKKLFFPP